MFNFLIVLFLYSFGCFISHAQSTVNITSVLLERSMLLCYKKNYWASFHNKQSNVQCAVVKTGTLKFHHTVYLLTLCAFPRWYSDVWSPAAFWIWICTCRCHFLHCPNLDWALDGCTDHTNMALVNGGGWIPQSWLLCGLSCISKWILWWVIVKVF